MTMVPDKIATVTEISMTICDINGPLTSYHVPMTARKTMLRMRLANINKLMNQNPNVCSKLPIYFFKIDKIC